MSVINTQSNRLEGRIPGIVFLAAVFSLLGLFVAWYVSREKYIYFWDFLGYHKRYVDLGSQFQLSPLRALRSVLLSVRHDEYNSLPTLFLMPFRFAFGPGRLAYISSIAAIFVFPSIALFSIAVRSLARDDEARGPFERAGLALLSVSAFALSPLLWVPVLQGIVDVGGLVIIFLVLILYFRADLKNQTDASLLSMALLLSLLVMYRRWYAYWVVGFLGAIAVCEALRFAREKERRAQFSLIVKNAVSLGSVCFLSFFLIATPIAVKMVTTDYTDIYSAYRSKWPILHNLGTIYDRVGPVTLVLAGLGIVFSHRNNKRQPVATFLCVQFVITYVLFTRTQDLGAHHLYWVLATLAFFLVFFARDVFLRAKTIAGKTVFLLAFLTVSLLTFAVTFLPGMNARLGPLEVVLPKARQYPKVRKDLPQMQALMDTLSELSRESGSSIYILSSSFSLNSSLVTEACFLLDQPHKELAEKIDPTNDVDKRDGFPIQMLRAGYVVLTLPIGYHLAPRDQRVIGLLADQLVTREGIGKSYDKLNYEFSLEDGSSAFIYRKARHLDPIELKMLSDQFIEFYPNHKHEFELSPPLIRELSAL